MQNWRCFKIDAGLAGELLFKLSGDVEVVTNLMQLFIVGFKRGDVSQQSAAPVCRIPCDSFSAAGAGRNRRIKRIWQQHSHINAQMAQQPHFADELPRFLHKAARIGHGNQFISKVFAVEQTGYPGFGGERNAGIFKDAPELPERRRGHHRIPHPIRQANQDCP